MFILFGVYIFLLELLMCFAVALMQNEPKAQPFLGNYSSISILNIVLMMCFAVACVTQALFLRLFLNVNDVFVVNPLLYEGFVYFVACYF